MSENLLAFLFVSWNCILELVLYLIPEKFFNENKLLDLETFLVVFFEFLGSAFIIYSALPSISAFNMYEVFVKAELQFVAFDILESTADFIIDKIIKKRGAKNET